MVALGNSFCLILILPEVIQNYQKKYKCGENEVLNDKCSGLFNSNVCLGSMIGPLIGGWMNDKYGFRVTNDAMAIFIGIYSFIYLTMTWEKSKDEKLGKSYIVEIEKGVTV